MCNFFKNVEINGFAPTIQSPGKSQDKRGAGRAFFGHT
jgi:hypothetical protein